MKKHLLLLEAAPAFLAVVDRAGASGLGRATPCAGWDVRALLDHLLEWGPPLEGAARKESVPPAPAHASARAQADPMGEQADPVRARADAVGALTDSVRAQAERIAEAWGAPAAWEGGTVMGAAELPADLVGGMVLGEFVLHGWDLARALDVPIEFSGDVLRLMYGEVARSAEQGRAMGVYGPEVVVPVDAPLLDRVLGLSGRDPFWKA